jgi:hypothetical protein
MRTYQLIELYFRVCEVYDNHLIQHCFRHTKNGIQPKFTDAEVLTCYLFATGWEKRNGPKACYDFMSNYYSDWFPDLPSYEGFNHRLNSLAEVLPIFTQYCFDSWMQSINSMTTKTILTDSFPVVTASGKRHPSKCGVITNKGKCATKAMWFHGVKVHVGAFEQSGTLPIPAYLIIAPASVHDKTAQQQELSEFINTTVIADRAYVDSELEKMMRENNSELITPPRYGKGTTEEFKQRNSSAFKLANTVVAKFRQPIETIFAWLVEAADIERASRIRSYRGLLIHIYGKIAAVICRRKLSST